MKNQSSVLKLCWMITLIVFILIIITIFTNRPITLSVDESIFSQISILFWIEITFFFAILYITSLFPCRQWQIVALVLLFFFVFYSSNLFFSSPYSQTDRSIFFFAEIMKRTDYIDQNILSLESYFQWPIFFIYLKLLDLILDSTTNHLISIGFFLFILLLSIFLFLFIGKDMDPKISFSVPIIYILISYHFIVDQFAPQMMGFLFAVLIFGIYYHFEPDIKFKFIIIILYFTLVFTHPFTFIFVLGSIVIEFLYNYIPLNKVLLPVQCINIRLILLLISIYLLGFVYRFLSIYSKIINFGDNLGFGVSETIRVLWNFLGTSVMHSGGHLLYRLVPELYVKTFSNLSRLVLIIFVILFIFGFTLNHNKIYIKITDGSIILFGTIFYAIGLFTSLLGQRSLQVISLSISRIYGELLNQSKIIVYLVGILIMITPVIFNISTVMNISIDGGYFIQDDEMDYAGRFVDQSAIQGQSVFCTVSSYPTAYPVMLKKFTDYRIILDGKKFNKIDLIIESPKLKLTSEYFGLNLENIMKSAHLGQVYDNGISSIHFNAHEK